MIANMNARRGDIYPGDAYFIKFHQPKFEKWDGTYRLIDVVTWTDYWDEPNIEYYVFINSTGLTVLAELSMGRWDVFVKKNNEELCQRSDKIYVDDKGTFANNIKLINVNVIHDKKEREREQRWEERFEFLSYLEESKEQVNERVNKIVDNSDLRRFITEYI